VSAPSGGRRRHWILLAFAPSSLLLGVTTHLTTDVAAAPLFWVVPLMLYLLSFVLAFQRSVRIPLRITAFVQALLLVCLGMVLLSGRTDEVVALRSVGRAHPLSASASGLRYRRETPITRHYGRAAMDQARNTP
jgi:hypothetical protein